MSGGFPIDEGTGPPLLVFHGWSGSHRNVERWLPALAPRFRVMVPDLPGCNGLAPLSGPHTGEAYARHALGLLDGAGIREAYAGGLCSGTVIALALARIAPERVTGLLLHTPFLSRDLIRPAIRLQLGVLASPLGRLYAPLRRSDVLATVHRRLFANAGEVAREQLAQDQADLVRADARAARELARDLLEGDRTETVRRWSGPLGVLLADADAFVDARRVADAIRALAPQASVETIAGGHGWTPAFVSGQTAALTRLAAALVAPRAVPRS